MGQKALLLGSVDPQVFFLELDFGAELQGAAGSKPQKSLLKASATLAGPRIDSRGIQLGQSRYHS